MRKTSKTSCIVREGGHLDFPLNFVTKTTLRTCRAAPLTKLWIERGTPFHDPHIRLIYTVVGSDDHRIRSAILPLPAWLAEEAVKLKLSVNLYYVRNRFSD